MKTLDEALAFIKDWEGAADGRDKERFAVFVPFDRIAEAGGPLIHGKNAESLNNCEETHCLGSRKHVTGGGCQRHSCSPP